jgi:hypothetical protein
MIVLALLLGAATPSLARPVGGYRASGPRGGTVTHAQGAYRSGTVVRGPNGGTAAHYSGPYRAGTAVRGPNGYGAVHGRGPYGARTAVSRPSYAWRGVHYYRPGWNAARVNGYGRAFYRYPGYRSYGLYYGLVPSLAAYSSLAFLSAGLLTASYVEQETTVYVYVVNEGGQDVEYRVDQNGNILSRTPINGDSEAPIE